MSANGLMSRLGDVNFDWSSSDINMQVDNSYIGYKTLNDEIKNVPLLGKAWDMARYISGDQDEKTVAKFCYTLESPNFYLTCNRELRKWFKSMKNETFPFNNYVKTMECQTDKFTGVLTLWRGVPTEVCLLYVYTFKHCQPWLFLLKKLDLMKKGQNITSNQFLSCSIIKQTAQAFAGNGILFKFQTPYAILIGEDSAFPGEKEYVIPPGMEFKITEFRKRDSTRNYHEMDLKLVEIKIASSVRNDLVLDASRFNVTLEKDCGKQKQRWFIQGRYIRNSYDGDVLDIDQPGADKISKIRKGHKVCTWPLHCQQNQEWFFNEDQTIESGLVDFVMDVDIEVREGAPLIVWSKNRKNNQLFKVINL